MITKTILFEVITLKYFEYLFQVEPNGLCMASAILMQVVHDPHKYTAESLMRQAVMHMLRNQYRYYEALEMQLIRTGESYESYVYNVFHRNIWGDDLLTTIIGDMWNIAISIVTPIHKKPVALFHNKDVPDVIIVANGGNYMSNDGSTHFSATRCYEEGFKLPGSEYRNPTLAQDLSSKLSPIIRWFKFTLKPPYSIAHDKLQLAIWDTSFWTFWLKFGHKGP